MLEYEKGGEMIAHNHKQSEDYTALLYLNNCNNGSFSKSFSSQCS